MQGASPLASPGLNPSGTGTGAAYHALAGGLPRRCRMTLPFRNSQGRLAPALPADLAIPEFTGTACLLCRLPTLPLVCFIAPYPPSPLPRRGRGSPKDYFAGGFAPGTPAFNRLRHRLNLPCRYPAGGLPSLSPPYPAFSVLFCPPSPRPPSPVGKGAPQRLFRRGLRPRHPCAEPGRHRSRGGVSRAGGGLPRRCRMTLPFRNSQGRLPSLSPPYPAFSVLFCPLSPRPPSPTGKGEIQGYFMQGASPLASPGLNPSGTGTGAAYHALAGGLPRRCRMTLPFRNSQGRLAFFVAALPCL